MYDHHRRKLRSVMVEGGSYNAAKDDVKEAGPEESQAAQRASEVKLKEDSTQPELPELIPDISEDFRRERKLYASCK